MNNLNNSFIKKIEIYIPSELGYEKIPIITIAIIAKKLGYSSEQVENMKMAMGEAVTNAIEHGNQLHVDTRVHVIIIEQLDSITLKIIDQGRKPMPVNIPVDRKGRVDNRGWGTLLITDLMDKVTVTVEHGCNEVEMIAYLKQ